MTTFEQQKQHQLSKGDMSKKGFIDEEIKFLVEKLNKMPEFYTTSSCAGRALLLEKKSAKKFDIDWIYSDHGGANLKKIKKVLENPPKNPVWLKQESAILHICCKDEAIAAKLLVVCKHSGFKHSGILSLGKRIIVQVLSSESLETIIADKGEVLVDDNYIKILVGEANKKMKQNKERIKRLYDNVLEKFG
jgi:tRNA wybutosine-synthesizing protein 3